ncbi:hypothetical protein VE02_08665 [Pseudogymnoascus sp. 03VT05]|nr:hypothetical protein VE02_08665 [Pseudogymnoascus sp. 03VT05]
MEDDYADVFDPRDNLYPNGPSLATEDFQFLPRRPQRDPNFCFDTAVDLSTIQFWSFDPLLDPLDFSLDSSAFPTEIQSSVSNDALPSSLEANIPPPWALFAMNEIIPESHESIQDIEQTVTDGNEPPSGTTQGSFGPRLDRHNHPYVCNHQSCNRKSFSNKSGLERHKREVHSLQQFKCPVPSCSRSKAGFHRRYNLDMHQRRVHGYQSQSSNSPPGLYNNLEDSEEGEEIILRPPRDLDVGLTNAMPQDGALKTQERFERKLWRLTVMRDELDEDIKSMERASLIMGSEY